MPSLPLFPLGTVLLPGASLPLRVFEPRYLDLLRDIGDRSPDAPAFGVVTIRRGREVGADVVNELGCVGCVAQVRQIHPPSGDRPFFAVESVGGARFRLERIDESAGTRYPTGVVTWLEEQPPTHASEAQLRRAYLALCEELRRAPTEQGRSGNDLVYAVALAHDLTLAERQSILEASTGTVAAEMLTALLRRELSIAPDFRLAPPQPPPTGPQLN
ncbi:MAG: LON peptidase substrate-binding domain-containing protein [Micrococcales bacterium]|nr:LON peptidase substrate-binding domain-containing protein [Micrococcales bacterium]